jgi:hypothetical protein
VTLRVLVGPALLSALLVSAAQAATPPVVPAFVQGLLTARAGELAYVPTRLPFRYRYRSYRYDPAAEVVTLRFADSRFAVTVGHSLVFTVERFPGAFSTCGDGRQKTLQMGGNKVYWDGSVAWRCQRSQRGGIVKLLAAGPNLPDVALGRVVASGKRVG